MDRGPPLHVPRLPRVRARHRRRRGRAAPGRGHASSASCATPRARRAASPSCRARVRALARAPQLLVLTKANARSPVHRSSYLDYVGVKRFGADGEVVGERRFVGLYTTAAYRSAPHDIPVVRRKAAAVIERAAFPRGSHDEKALIEIVDTYPRDELFQIPEDELYAIATGILDLGERQRVRLFVRHDRYERFVSCLVFLPRDRFHTQNRERVGEILREEFQGESVDWELRLSESVLVRIHYVVHVPPGELPAYDAAKIEARIVEATRAWSDELEDALVEEFGEEAGHRAVPPLRPRVAGRLPRRLARPLGGRRPAADRGAGRRRRARHEPLPPARGARRHVPLQALPARRARIAVRRAADVREHGARGARRAPLPRHAARGPARLDLRPRAPRRGRRRRRRRPDPRAVPRRLHAHLARRRRAGRIQRADHQRRPRLARGDAAALGRPLRAPGGDRVQRQLHGAHADRPRRHRRQAGRPVPRPLRPGAGAPRRRRRERARPRSRRRSTRSRASTRTASCAASTPSSARCCGRTSSSRPPTGGRSRTSRSSSTRRASRSSRCRGRASRSSCTRRASRACTCAAAASRAAACAGRTGARTSARRSSG